MAMMSGFRLSPRQMDFDGLWPKIETCILALLKRNPICRRLWDELFYDIYSLCIAVPVSHAYRLYCNIRDLLCAHVDNLRELLSEVSDESLLMEYCSMWRIYFEGSMRLDCLFRYLNKEHISSKFCSSSDVSLDHSKGSEQEEDLKEIGKLALLTWYSDLLFPLHERILNRLWIEVCAFRKSMCLHPGEDMTRTISSFIELDNAICDPKNSSENIHSAYYVMFEPAFLALTSEYYGALSDELIAKHPPSEYITVVRRIIDIEEAATTVYLNDSTYTKNATICYKETIEKQHNKMLLLAQEFLKAENYEGIKVLYSLLAPLPNLLLQLINEFEEHIKVFGFAAIDNMSSSNLHQEFFDIVLQIYRKFRNLSTIFTSNTDFIVAIDKALHATVQHVSEGLHFLKAHELIVKHIDSLFRKLSNSGENMENVLDNCLIVFKYIEDKDAFLSCYLTFLSSRLVYRSSSMEVEEAMINKLRQVCGFNYTSKMSRMLNDMTSSDELTAQFKQQVGTSSATDIALNFSILQSCAWPISSVTAEFSSCSSFVLPRQLAQSMEEFESFYTKKFTGRKLTWNYLSSFVELLVNYFEKPYIMTVNAHQLAVLWQFQNKNTSTLMEIQQQTGLPADESKRTIRQLVDAHIFKTPAEVNTDWADDTEFMLNLDVKWKRLRVRIASTLASRQIGNGSTSMQSSTHQDRKYLIDCLIVKIMKEKKLLRHDILIDEVVERAKNRFVPDITATKLRIESLIERQFIQRTDNYEEYQYLA